MKVGLIGWRGMVGSVLVQRMKAEGDFDLVEPHFFSTSQAGSRGPAIGGAARPVKDARSIEDLAAIDVLISCQGGDYTNEIHPRLRGRGWSGYWIDAASALRMRDDAVIVLDPVNMDVIEKARAQGVKDYIGGNCTVSLMLMALGGLFKAGLVEWMTAMTYQAASGAGAAQMRELVQQMGVAHEAARALLENPSSSIT
ncbi:MAG: aspartate-semialdehyde dehydrogenase, partial [Burkholderiales bacterium]